MAKTRDTVYQQKECKVCVICSDNNLLKRKITLITTPKVSQRINNCIKKTDDKHKIKWLWKKEEALE